MSGANLMLEHRLSTNVSPARKSMSTEHRAREHDFFANQSVLGEEDPGAALDSISRNGCEQVPGNPQGGQTDVLLTNAELVQLQIRVIALENLVAALLAGATHDTSKLARELAGDISPRPGSTPHHLTIHAAAQMVHLVERSSLFRGEPGVRKHAGTGTSPD
jgi:hypothetical protein